MIRAEMRRDTSTRRLSSKLRLLRSQVAVGLATNLFLLLKPKDPCNKWQMKHSIHCSSVNAFTTVVRSH